MKQPFANLMRQFSYDDKRIGHLLGMFDEYVRFIRNYDDQLHLDGKYHESAMLAGYWLHVMSGRKQMKSVSEVPQRFVVIRNRKRCFVNSST